MFQTLLTSIFGSRNSRLLKQYRRRVARINALEPQMEALSDDELRGKTREFQTRIQEEVAAGKPVNDVLDAILPEAFAVCREGSKRILGMRHFDVQMLGAMVLNAGKIAEMRTGEGKTLTATLAVYLNALAGRGVHVVTVNDYLAQRDAAWMGRLYNFLGLTVGVIVAQQPSDEKRAAYQADITYGTNNEYGFDYLRDNMVDDIYNKVQRELNFAVVDEVDSILIDEARTPLIISGQANDNVELYQIMNQVPAHLTPQEKEDSPEGDYWVDEKNMQVVLSEQGHEHAEQILTQLGLLQENESLYASNNIMLMHHLMAALRAHTLFHLDQHYVVKPNEEGQPEIVIVDEHTGRLMDGRRWSDGLHQAVEAKEGVEVQKENQTLASITFQNYFRLYTKLSGMTGTADTEAYEFQSIYGLETVIIPTNKPIQRKDFNDQIFRTAEEKYEAVIKDIKDCYERGQPVLVGTTTIENSELVSHLLKREGLPHNVLNAKEHEREALIVAQAGKPKMITVATNMAGRGTDIVLGGNVQHQADAIRADESLTDEQKQAQIKALEDSWEAEHQAVVDAGGLHIIGTERHESRRIDNQLRGRAGRQGDPGSSRFYLSFEDPLLRLFALDRAAAILNRLAPEPGVAIEANILTRQIENAQRKVEGRNFDMRKQVLEYDDVANDQRRVLYHQRNEILGNKDISEMLQEWRTTVIGGIVDMYMPADSMEEQWDIPAMMAKLAGEFNVHVDVSGWLKADNTLENEEVKERVLAQVDAEYQAKKDLVGDEVFSNFERSVVLQVVDTQWREHLAAMDYLRQGIGLRGYAQKDPKQEYKREAFAMFESLWHNIQYNTTSILVSAQIQPHQPEPDTAGQPENAVSRAWSNVENGAFDPANPTEEDKQFFPDALEARGIAVHRNDPCPCGSGLKYKQCHGRLV